MSSSTTTSSVPSKSKSSSAQNSPAQSVTGQTIAGNVPASKNSWFIENAQWIVPTSLGVIIAGVIGYFTQIMQLKDDISNNKTEISLAKKDIDYLKEKAQKNEVELNEISKLKTDVILIQTQLSSLNRQNKK